MRELEANRIENRGSLKLDELSDSALVHWYNQRGETSENRLKELRSEIALWEL